MGAPTSASLLRCGQIGASKNSQNLAMEAGSNVLILGAKVCPSKEHTKSLVVGSKTADFLLLIH